MQCNQFWTILHFTWPWDHEISVDRWTWFLPRRWKIKRITDSVKRCNNFKGLAANEREMQLCTHSELRKKAALLANDNFDVISVLKCSSVLISWPHLHPSHPLKREETMKITIFKCSTKIQFFSGFENSCNIIIPDSCSTWNKNQFFEYFRNLSLFERIKISEKLSLILDKRKHLSGSMMVQEFLKLQLFIFRGCGRC